VVACGVRGDHLSAISHCLTRTLLCAAALSLVPTVWRSYEVNPEYVAQLQAAGLFFVGTDDRNQRMEIVELDREWRQWR
jgi:hypothetical protein